MSRTENRGQYKPYLIMAGIYIAFVLLAFILDTPGEIARGLWVIHTSRSILITDYIALGGIGATLINSVLVGSCAILLMMIGHVKPNGAIIMAVWLSTGFAFFGKNLFNMLPITLGVWLYARMRKDPFKNHSLASLLCATLSPVVSEVSFMGALPQPWAMITGILLGVFIGFIFPPLSASTVRIHNGYCLYNMGFSGGLIATFVVCLMKSFGVEFETARIWSSGNNLVFAVILYALSLGLVACGYFGSNWRRSWVGFRKMLRRPGRLVTDFYLLYRDSIYVNMGLLCALGTTVVLMIGGDLNGPTIGGILTIVGFGSFGKHPKNITPILIGALLGTHLNTWDPTSPSNTLAILFCTGLAPIAGQYGLVWGIVAGFLHVSIANFAGQLNSGLNLYNNGFAAVFVCMFLLPLINAFQRRSENEVQV